MKPVVALLAFIVVAAARPRSSLDHKPSKYDVSSDVAYIPYALPSTHSKHDSASSHNDFYHPGRRSHAVPRLPYHSVIEDSSEGVVDDYTLSLSSAEQNRASPRKHLPERFARHHSSGEHHVPSRHNKRSASRTLFRPQRRYRIPFTLGYVSDDSDWLSSRRR
ncbi:unnamed protein product, partial [Ixodes hexagonus]